MSKSCEICGKFMPERFHSACPKCLESSKRLPIHLKMLWDDYHNNRFTGKEKKSVRGILRAVNTLLFDGEWYSYKWDPVSNLRIVITSPQERRYLTVGATIELMAIIKKMEEERRKRA